MLEFLRRASQTWVVKGLLVLLVLSFGVWGVSTSLVASHSGAVVTVGDIKVSAVDFRLAYEREIAQLSRQFGTRLTPEQARAFGAEAQVYSQLVAGAALDQLASDMSLGLSKDRLAQLIAEDPTFRGVNGQFDRTTFSSVLRNAGLREQDYINNRSQVAVRSQIVEAISDGYTPPKTLSDALKHYARETRTIDYLLLSNANIDPVKAPADDVLAPWFESRKATYRAPEYRKISYVKLTPEDIADVSLVADDQIRQDYDRRIASFSTPETRKIEQLAFTSQAAADAAATKLAAGTSFDDLVASEAKTPADILLGTFAKDQVPDAKLADAAFALPATGGITPVVAGSFGPVILRVSEVTPAKVRTFDEVKDEIRKDLSLAAAAQDILGIHDRIEDARVAGTPLKETAESLKLKYQTVDAVAANGEGKDGETVGGIPESAALIAEAFKTDVGAETLPLTIGRDGYVWFEVEEVIPARDRTLDEVREKAIADWTAEQQRTALAAKATELKTRVEKGGALADIATELGIAVETKTGLRRSTSDAVLSPAAITAAFAGPEGHLADAEGIDGDGRILLKVTAVDDVGSGDVLDNDDRQIDAIAKASGDDILDQMVAELQTGYGVEINQTAAETALAQRR